MCRTDLEVNEKRVLRVLETVLEEKYPGYYSIGGYGENNVCIEKTERDWIVYIGDHGMRRGTVHCKDILAACRTLIQRIALDGDATDLKIRFMELLSMDEEHREDTLGA